MCGQVSPNGRASGRKRQASRKAMEALRAELYSQGFIADGEQLRGRCMDLLHGCMWDVHEGGVMA